MSALMMTQQLRAPSKSSLAAAPRRCAAAAPRGAVRVRAASSIVDTAVAAGNFKTLVAALTAAGLADTLKTGNFTVFAPTDAAFAKLPAGTVDALLKDKTRLTEILLFHVAKGKTVSKYIVNGSGQMPTMCEIPDPKRPDLGKWKVVICVDDKENGKNGTKLKIGQKCAVVQGLDYEVRGGYVEKADIECTNGVIHVMDTVMIPDVKFCGV